MIPDMERTVSVCTFGAFPRRRMHCIKDENTAVSLTRSNSSVVRRGSAGLQLTAKGGKLS